MPGKVADPGTTSNPRPLDLRPHLNVGCAPERDRRRMMRMQKGTRAEARIHVDVAPDVVYRIVSDVTRMGEWSPETTRCEWLDGASGPAVGARFKGTNKHGFVTWSTKPKVVVANPGREFAFDVGTDTRWTYRFDEEGSGTNLTESFEMLRDIRWYYAFAERWLMRVKDRRADLERGMAATLERIKVVVEAETPDSRSGNTARPR